MNQEAQKEELKWYTVREGFVDAVTYCLGVVVLTYALFGEVLWEIVFAR